MLQADDYIVRYRSDDKRALQLSKYYLNKWGVIERNASRLNEHYTEIAFLLFSALKEMTEEERKFLSDKYRVVIRKKSSKPDKEIAKEYGMELLEYQKLRRGVEYKFYSHLKPLIQKTKKEKGIDFKF